MGQDYILFGTANSMITQTLSVCPNCPTPSVPKTWDTLTEWSHWFVGHIHRESLSLPCLLNKPGDR